MASVDFRSDSNDLVCHLPKSDNNYFTALDATEATAATEHSVFYVGQRYSDPTYYIYRGAVCFDTSGLDDNCLIVSATLTLRCASNYASTLIIQSGAPTYPHVPQVVGDYNRVNYSGDGGRFTAAAGNNIVTLNFDGRSWINKTGYTKFLLRSQAEIKREAPTGDEHASFYGNYTSEITWRPKLTVVYTIPTAIPTVGNASYSGTKDTFTIASATPSDDGGGYKERGFEYGLSAEPTWAVRETGIFSGTSAFSLTISGLQPSTTYYGRAFVTNSFGTSYSDEWTSFTTTASPAYGLYEESNTATICFYISEDDGMTWGQKHGPYTTDQADINVTKLLVRGSGKKKIKFTTTALTGISASVMCKLDIKAR